MTMHAANFRELKLDRLSRDFGTHNALKNVSLTIRQGEFIALLGPSGCGKSTTLNLIAGLMPATGGGIWLDDKRIDPLRPEERGFGMVFQNYALFPHMTVAENIAYPLHVRKLPRAELEAKVKRALEMVQMDTMGMRYPAQMSGGQQQRVALARALVFDPQLVLMDEPLGALDKQLREHMQIELKALHRRLGVTFVYVTHDQAEALTMSDRVAVFNDGRIQQIDRVDRLYETPVNRFVANFVGDNAVLQAKVHATDGDTCDVVLPSGERLQGINVNRAGVGDAVQCSVRPERIELAEAARPNTVSGTVMDIIYFGDHLRLRCKLPSEAEVMVKLALGHSAVPTPGHRVHLHAPPQHMRVYL
jgi:putative spermidine/putrescine transport system ATP-binding protein